MQRLGRVLIDVEVGRLGLLVGGFVQSVAVDERDLDSGYWPAMLPDVRPERALLLGLGGGTVARLLLRRFGPLPIVGVDDDPDVIALGRARFNLGDPSLTIVLADAFAYVAACEEPFDYIAVDLYHGAEFQRGVLAKPFLRRLSALTQPHGTVAFNFMLDRRTASNVARVARILSPTRLIDVGKNLVVHCQPRSR